MKIKYYLCGGETPKSEYPLGLGYLKACFGGEIVSNRKELTNCDMIGLSSNDWGISEAIDILNNTNIPVIIGGQATMWDGLKEYGFKHIVRGEGEIPLSNIISGKEPISAQIANIDTIPFPDRGKCGSQAPILTSRGCPYKCNFCSSSTFWKGVRWHSADYVMEEVKYIKMTYPSVVSISIMDDLFTSNKKRLKEIHSKWNYNFHLEGFVRSNTFDKETGLIMKDMGFKSIRFGAESGSDEMLRKLNKQATVEDHQRTIDICNKIGVEAQASFMYDLPGETENDRKLTTMFMGKNKGKFRIVGNYRFRPFAGTKYYNNENIAKEDMRVR
jgi:radical SAM superfamily enzyme YgiQ (UPF0313 family)